MALFSIRPFREEDRALVNVFRCEGFSQAEQQAALARWEYEDAQRKTREVFLCLVAEDSSVGAPVGYLEVLDRSTTPNRKPGMCHMDLWVDKALRGKGIGSALYEHALAFAGLRHADYLRISLRGEPDESTLRFLQKRGFVELQRRQLLRCAVVGFAIGGYADLFQRLSEEGITIHSYGEEGDTEENRRRIYDLYVAIGRVDPRTDPFPEWVAENIAGVDWQKSLLLVAQNKGRWVGLHRIDVPGPAMDEARIVYTGTLPEERNRGIATALKAQAMQIMRQRGCDSLRTTNDLDNAPMQAVNKKLGFVAAPSSILFKKPLQ